MTTSPVPSRTMKSRESSLQRKVKDYLKAHGGWLFKVHGGPYQKSGVPDILYLYKGILYGFELKRDEKEEPSELQKLNIRQINENGGVASVVWTLEQIKDIIKDK